VVGVTFRTFRVYRDEDRTRIDVGDDLLGWGVIFPEGGVFVAWNREAFPEDDRLEEPHVSQYGTLADVEQGTGGVVQEVSPAR
jgi:hypothetical protein